MIYINTSPCRSFICSMTLFTLLALPPAAQAQHQGQQGQPQKLPTTELTAGMHRIQAMVAQTPDERSMGLMFRKEMGNNEGMLFIFEQAATQCFWMKNTLLPLSAAFIKDDGSIVNIEDMKPQTTDSHCSKEPVRYVLEMHQGWFAKRGLKAGSQLTGRFFKR
jgi:uncharacterized membrane protein (UPF0127 family)